jgi:hypothetical protein
MHEGHDVLVRDAMLMIQLFQKNTGSSRAFHDLSLSCAHAELEWCVQT